MKTGYCTNIHSGPGLRDVIRNLEQFAVPVKRAVSPGQPMGIGLWLSHQAVTDALTDNRWQLLADVLDENGLVASTFNAFPWSDFHQPVVKRDVYRPNWAEPARLEYTLQVAELLDRLLPAGQSGSISTLPVGWPGPEPDDGVPESAARQIQSCARRLAGLYAETGREIILAIEPEPGCLLQTSQDLCDFLDQYVFAGTDESVIRQHVGVCHDVCHAAVMFESQESVLGRYADRGIRLAKVQISSAIETNLRDDDNRAATIDELAAFDEPRYLHQTSIQDPNGSSMFFSELGPAIDFLRDSSGMLSARTHFHVPIHMSKIGRLATTQSDIADCLNWIANASAKDVSPHLEVETYAWSVSPEALQGGSLADSLVSELVWLHERLPAPAAD